MFYNNNSQRVNNIYQNNIQPIGVLDSPTPTKKTFGLNHGADKSVIVWCSSNVTIIALCGGILGRVVGQGEGRASIWC